MKVTESPFSHLHYPFRKMSAFLKGIAALLVNSRSRLYEGGVKPSVRASNCPCPGVFLGYGLGSPATGWPMSHIAQFGGSDRSPVQLYQGVIPKAFQKQQSQVFLCPSPPVFFRSLFTATQWCFNHRSLGGYYFRRDFFLSF